MAWGTRTLWYADGAGGRAEGCEATDGPTDWAVWVLLVGVAQVLDERRLKMARVMSPH